MNDRKIKISNKKNNILARNILILVAILIIIGLFTAKYSSIIYDGIFYIQNANQENAFEKPNSIGHTTSIHRQADRQTEGQADKQIENNEIIANNSHDNKSNESILSDLSSMFTNAMLPSFAPNNDEIESSILPAAEDKKDLSQNPYEAQIDKDYHKDEQHEYSKHQAKTINELNNYRLFLANAGSLINKFKEEKTYTKDLMIFNSVNHPQMIKNILMLLDDYNKTLFPSECKPTDRLLTFFSTKPLNKFIKITKITEDTKSQRQLKDGINESLPILINYIYSLELQENFVKFK